MLKGTATHRRQETKIPYQIEYNATKEQRLHIDIMFINEMGFLVSVSKPLNLTMCQKLCVKEIMGSEECTRRHAASARDA